MFLQLKVEIVRPKDLVIPVQLAPGGIQAFVDDGSRDLGCHAARGGDQPGRMALEEIVIDPWKIIKPLKLGRAGDLQQVMVTGLIFGQQEQVG